MNTKPTKNRVPFAVIDIGSNSVRLVVFEGQKRNPVTFFNEKVLCGLGREMGETGELAADGMKSAYRALRRFRTICDELSVKSVESFATAAVREASNRDVFLKKAESILGESIDVWSGDDEANKAGYGVLAGMPSAQGLVGDLGGGSLELVRVGNGQVEKGITLPLGSLRIAHMMTLEAKELARRTFRNCAYLSEYTGDTLYLVGGAWRAFARVHVGQSEYPVQILHNYEMKADEAMSFAALISRLSQSSLDDIKNVSQKRLETLPNAAIVLHELIIATKAKRIVISGFGVREGLLFSRLDDKERQKDPLVEGARELSARTERIVELGDGFKKFTDGLLADEPAWMDRIRWAACELSDIAWRDHPNYRRVNAFYQLLHAPLSGITHQERTFLALSVYNRYRGDGTPEASAVSRILSSEDQTRAKALGQALRLGHILSGHAVSILNQCQLKREDTTLVLVLPKKYKKLEGEVVRRRLDSLAATLNLQSDVEVRD